MKKIINQNPCCPECNSNRKVGKTVTFFNGNRKNGYFCSNCLIEFENNMSIIPPVWEFRASSL